MEEVLDATFYNDDFLTRTLTSSVLYDKSQLYLNFGDNNNSLPNKSSESPNLDFLKLGSPDLEQIFININDTSALQEPPKPAYSLDADLLAAENCFTDALQQLHDKQEIGLSEKKIGKENLHNKLIDKRKQNVVVPPQEQERVVYNNCLPNNNNLLRRNNNFPVAQQNKILSRLNPAPIAQPQHIQQRQQQQIMKDQIMLNNQLVILNNQAAINPHHLQQQQQQQEIAFLTQAMALQAERETNFDGDLPINFQPPQHPHNNISAQNNISTQQNNISAQQQQNSISASHLQQKILEQHLLQQQTQQQQQQLPFANNNNNIALQQQPQHQQDVGIDEHTLKMLMENPHMVPVNLELQELIKRERKKLRNRVASSKCRKRKLEREGRLEDRVKDLKERNIELNAVANALKQQICDLKQRVMDHVGEGCQIVLPS